MSAFLSLLGVIFYLNNITCCHIINNIAIHPTYYAPILTDEAIWTDWMNECGCTSVQEHVLHTHVYIGKMRINGQEINCTED